MTNSAAVELLYENIGRLGHPEHGVIDLIPFQSDTETARHARRMVAEAIVYLLEQHGHIQQPVTTTDYGGGCKPTLIGCTQCGTTLTAVVAPTNGRLFIESMAKRDPQCPHKVLTAEDHRRRIE